MSSYQDCRLDIELISPVGTPWHSDTIMGHLAWCVVLRDGEPGLKRFLEPFLQGCPPFVVSDGFPSGMLPAPFFPPVGAAADMSAADTALTKARKRAPFLSTSDFDSVRRGNTDDPSQLGSPWQSVETIHALIDRTSFTTEGVGKVFTTYSEALDLRESGLSIYLRCEEGSLNHVADLFEFLSSVGFGRDKSTGSGQFRVASLAPCDAFPTFPGADGFISLSTFVPAAGDPVEGFWKVNVKRGKLGENAGHGNPFKRPLVQFVPGSVFLTKNNPLPWYGRTIQKIAPAMPQALQICLCLAVPCRFPVVR